MKSWRTEGVKPIHPPGRDVKTHSDRRLRDVLSASFQFHVLETPMLFLIVSNENS